MQVNCRIYMRLYEAKGQRAESVQERLTALARVQVLHQTQKASPIAGCRLTANRFVFAAERSINGLSPDERLAVHQRDTVYRCGKSVHTTGVTSLGHPPN